jgi:hypothetical protein
MAVYLTLIAWHSDYSFMWDSSSYLLDCVIPAGRALDLFALNCTNHPSMAYFLPFGILQWLAPGNVLGVHALNALYGSIGIAAFHATLRAAVPALRTRPAELAGLTLLLALHPVYLASTLFFNPDFGVAVFFLLSLALLAYGHLGWGAVAGVGLVLSKEFGTPLYGLLMVAWALGALPLSSTTQNRLTKQTVLLLMSPLLVFLVVQLANYLVQGKWMLWKDWSGNTQAAQARFVPGALSYLFGLFVLNFHWLLTALTAVFFFGWWKARSTNEARKSQVLFLSLVLVPGAAMVVMAPQIRFLNVRYLLCIYAAALLLYAVAVSQDDVRAYWRWGATAVLGALFALSSFRTVDPVSMATTGTFDFGTHKMLKMTALTGECCGHGRDQLVYNLEFLQFQKTFRKLLEKEDWKDTYLHIERLTEFALRGSPTPLFLQETLNGTNPLISVRAPRTYSRHVFALFPSSEYDINLSEVPAKFEASRGFVASDGYRLPFVRLIEKNKKEPLPADGPT